MNLEEARVLLVHSFSGFKNLQPHQAEDGTLKHTYFVAALTLNQENPVLEKRLGKELRAAPLYINTTKTLTGGYNERLLVAHL